MSHQKVQGRVVVSKDGPYLVTGEVPLSEQIIATDSEGGSESWEQGATYKDQASFALCRCGRSKKKPFCDGTHAKTGFDGTETASRAPYREQPECRTARLLWR
jgi:CDGSH-type Zn-finger protein